jgi:hypothetical protein
LNASRQVCPGAEQHGIEDIGQHDDRDPVDAFEDEASMARAQHLVTHA